jgi:hypothetical protein
MLGMSDRLPGLGSPGAALRFGAFWRKRGKGTQSKKGNRWVERILSLKQTCRIRSMADISILVEARFAARP